MGVVETFLREIRNGRPAVKAFETALAALDISSLEALRAGHQTDRPGTGCGAQSSLPAASPLDRAHASEGNQAHARFLYGRCIVEPQPTGLPFLLLPVECLAPDVREAISRDPTCVRSLCLPRDGDTPGDGESIIQRLINEHIARDLRENGPISRRLKTAYGLQRSAGKSL